MSHQLTFADSEFSSKRRQTRKEIFLSRMEQILPWQDMTAVTGLACFIPFSETTPRRTRAQSLPLAVRLWLPSRVCLTMRMTAR